MLTPVPQLTSSTTVSVVHYAAQASIYLTLSLALLEGTFLLRAFNTMLQLICVPHAVLPLSCLSTEPLALVSPTVSSVVPFTTTAPFVLLVLPPVSY